MLRFRNLAEKTESHTDTWQNIDVGILRRHYLDEVARAAEASHMLLYE